MRHARPASSSSPVTADVPEKDSENAMWKPVVLDGRTGQGAVPNGSVGFRYGDEGLGKNLDLGEIQPQLSLLGAHDGTALVRFPRFDAEGGLVAYETRGVPVRTIGGRLVTTVLDLLLAPLRGWLAPVCRARGRPGMPTPRSRRPRVGGRDHRRARRADHPAGPRVGAERDRHPGPRDDPHGRGDQPLVPLRPDLPGDAPADDDHRVPGRNGGGWAHYVGQEKIRPIMGRLQHLAFALDWHRPPRQIMNQTAYWYVNTSQYRYDTFTADDLDAGTGVFAGKGVMDRSPSRCGWAGRRAIRPSTAAASPWPTRRRRRGWSRRPMSSSS